MRAPLEADQEVEQIVLLLGAGAQDTATIDCVAAPGGVRFRPADLPRHDAGRIAFPVCQLVPNAIYTAPRQRALTKGHHATACLTECPA